MIFAASPVTASLASSGPPADCANLINSAQTLSGITPMLTSTFTTAVTKGSSITYSFTVHSTRQALNQPPGGPTFTRLEDCGYANATPTNIKYATETLNPKFQGGDYVVTLTVATLDVVCHRVTVVGTDALGVPFQDFTNQVGVGGGAVNAAACVNSTPAVAASGSGPPADCATVLSTPQNVDGTGKPFLTKTLSQTFRNGSTITYFFTIHSTRQATGQPPGGPTYSNIEDCAYIAGTPSNIKYGTQSVNPPFQSGDVTVTITADATDTICDRVVVDGTDAGGTKFTDFTNLVGSGPTGTGNGGPDPTACAGSGAVPEASAWQIPLVGLVMLMSVEAVRRRRRHPVV
jgi:hypothetical protein